MRADGASAASPKHRGAIAKGIEMILRNAGVLGASFVLAVFTTFVGAGQADDQPACTGGNMTIGSSCVLSADRKTCHGVEQIIGVNCYLPRGGPGLTDISLGGNCAKEVSGIADPDTGDCICTNTVGLLAIPVAGRNCIPH